MPEPARRQPALAPQALRPRGIRLGERTGSARSTCAATPGERAFMTGVGRVLDLLLPTEPNSSASKGAITALWLGPDQWLLTCPADDAAFFISSLREALADVHARSPTSQRRPGGVRARGPERARRAGQGLPARSAPARFTPGSCAQSLLAKADGPDPPARRRAAARAHASTSTSPAPSPTTSGPGSRTPAASTACRSSNMACRFEAA